MGGINHQKLGWFMILLYHYWKWPWTCPDLNDLGYPHPFRKSLVALGCICRLHFRNEVSFNEVSAYALVARKQNPTVLPRGIPMLTTPASSFLCWEKTAPRENQTNTYLHMTYMLTRHALNRNQFGFVWEYLATPATATARCPYA